MELHANALGAVGRKQRHWRKQASVARIGGVRRKTLKFREELSLVF